MSKTTPIKTAIKRDIKASRWRFYVYILLRPNGDPFYVGCSGSLSSFRLFDHEMYAKSGEQSLRSSIIRKIRADGDDVRYRIDSWHQSAGAMFEREVDLISTLGRRDLGYGILANGNFGGTGMMGPSDETREKIRAGHKKRWTPEAREAQRQRVLDQHRKDPTLRVRIGASQEGRWTTEERAKQGDRARLALQNPEVRKSISRSQKKWFADPVHLAAHADAARLRVANRPELREILSAAQKRNWEDPAYRCLMIQNMNLSIAKRKAANIPMGRRKKVVVA